MAIPPPLPAGMSPGSVEERIARSEKSMAFGLAMIPTVFAAQCFLVSISFALHFEPMYADFGAQLPAITEFSLRFRLLWLILPPGVAIVALFFARKESLRFSAVFSSISGLGLFLLAQLITYAAFLPIFQLGSVAAGLEP
jgi:hypothetical protein